MNRTRRITPDPTNLPGPVAGSLARIFFALGFRYPSTACVCSSAASTRRGRGWCFAATDFWKVFKYYANMIRDRVYEMQMTNEWRESE